MPDQPVYQSPGISPAAPTINGREITIDMLLKNPQYIESRVANLALENFIAPYIFAQGPALTTGVVKYDTVLKNDLYLTRGLRTIAEKAEYPIVDAAEPAPSVAIAGKFGGQYEISYEAQRRNAIDVMDRVQVKMANDQVQKVDADAMDLFAADDNVPEFDAAGNGWGDAVNGNIFLDIARASSTIRNQRLGYRGNLVLINPAENISIMSSEAIRAALPRENPATNPVLSAQINGLFGLEWIESEHVPMGTAYLLQRGAIGTIADEVPWNVRVIDEPKRDVTIMLGGRTTVQFITDPLAAVRITGVGPTS